MIPFISNLKRNNILTKDDEEKWADLHDKYKLKLVKKILTLFKTLKYADINGKEASEIHKRNNVEKNNNKLLDDSKSK